jgi:hypothetical protein
MAIKIKIVKRNMLHGVCTAGRLVARRDGYFSHVSIRKKRGILNFSTTSSIPAKATHIIRTVYV